MNVTFASGPPQLICQTALRLEMAKIGIPMSWQALEPLTQGDEPRPAFVDRSPEVGRRFGRVILNAHQNRLRSNFSSSP